MLEKLKNIIFIIFLGGVLLVFNHIVDSTFITTFLKKDLITILIALLAINITTFSVILTSINSIKKEFKCNFKNTIKEMKKSITEQVLHIIIAVMIISMMESVLFKYSHQYIKIIVETCLTSVFVAALFNLHDTAASVFIISEHDESDE